MSVEQSNILYNQAAELLAEQLCLDCPLRNWLGQAQLEGELASPDFEQQKDVAISQAGVLSAVVIAGVIKARTGCEGREDANHICEGCGNVGSCGAVNRYNELVDEE